MAKVKAVTAVKAVEAVTANNEGGNTATTPAGGKRDAKPPASITLTAADSSGASWGNIVINPKNFSTGSVGFFNQGKLCNPANPEARYQCSVTFTLIGSKAQA